MHKRNMILDQVLRQGFNCFGPSFDCISQKAEMDKSKDKDQNQLEQYRKTRRCQSMVSDRLIAINTINNNQ